MDLSSYMQVRSAALRVIVWEASNGKNSIFRGEVRLLFLHHSPMWLTDRSEPYYLSLVHKAPTKVLLLAVG